MDWPGQSCVQKMGSPMCDDRRPHLFPLHCLGGCLSVDALPLALGRLRCYGRLWTGRRARALLSRMPGRQQAAHPWRPRLPPRALAALAPPQRWTAGQSRFRSSGTRIAAPQPPPSRQGGRRRRSRCGCYSHTPRTSPAAPLPTTGTSAEIIGPAGAAPAPAPPA